MFRRRTVAVLDVCWKLETAGSRARGNGTGEFLTSIVVYLRNSSNVTARFPYVHLAKGGFDLLGEIPGLPRNADNEWFFFEGGADQVINPGVERCIAKLIFEVPRLLHSNPPAPEITEANEKEIQYRCGCEHRSNPARCN